MRSCRLPTSNPKRACALKSTGLMRYVTPTSQCKKSEVKVTIKPGPVLTCVQPDGTVRKVSSFSKCRPPALRLTLPPTSGTVYFCAADSTGLLRHVTDPSRCTSTELLVSVTTNDATPSVNSTLPANNARHIAVNKNIEVTFSEAVSATTSSFTLVCGGDAKTFAPLGSGTSTITLDPTFDLPEGTSCTVTANKDGISDTDALDPPDNLAANHVFSFTTDGAPTAVSLTPTPLTPKPAKNVATGALAELTASGAGFSATGGGTVTVQTGTNANTIDTTTGTALNVANTTIGSNGLTFRSIAANGAANGIVLNGTGSNGLTVTGDSTLAGNGSGGAIQIRNPDHVLRVCTEGLGAVQRPAPADQPEPDALLPARHYVQGEGRQ